MGEVSAPLTQLNCYANMDAKRHAGYPGLPQSAYSMFLFKSSPSNILFAGIGPVKSRALFEIKVRKPNCILFRFFHPSTGESSNFFLSEQNFTRLTPSMLDHLHLYIVNQNYYLPIQVQQQFCIQN